MQLTNHQFRFSLVAVILVLFCLNGCEDSSTTNIPVRNITAEDRAYFPLFSGNTWKYAIVSNGDTTQFYDYIIGHVLPGETDIRAILTHQQSSHSTEEYARWIYDEFRVSSEHQYEVEIVWLKVPLTIGQSWEMYNYTNENLVYESLAKVTDDSVDVSTVAGDFKAVEIMEIFKHYATDEPAFQDTCYHYYVKDIGRVKSVEPGETHELRFYNVHPEE